MNQKAPRAAVLVMTRWWAQGPVKTRLAADIGQQAAREIYRDMTKKLWLQLQSSALRRILCVSPTERLAEVADWLANADQVLAQPQGDLGTRMSTLLSLACAAPDNDFVAVIGTDAPAIDASWILHAGSALAHNDVVITPSEDGGYAMLALRQAHPSLFEDIPWSTGQVLAVTLQRAEEARLTVALTAAVRDLDDIHDLHALQDVGLLP